MRGWGYRVPTPRLCSGGRIQGTPRLGSGGIQGTPRLCSGGKYRVPKVRLRGDAGYSKVMLREGYRLQGTQGKAQGGYRVPQG